MSGIGVRPPRIAVVGHVEHITLGRVSELPREGEIAHVESPQIFPGGGGGIAFHQLAKSDAELLLYTALGDDDGARLVEMHLQATGAQIYTARRAEPHTRDVVMVTPKGERTIVVVGQPLHPHLDDPLPWTKLALCDAAYFTAQDPAALEACRRAQVLVVTARRQEAIARSGVHADVVVGSASDPREASTLSDYARPPRALVMTEGSAGGYVEDAGGRHRFETPRVGRIAGGAYGAGDSFAGALTYYLALGLSPLEAATLAAHYGAAVLAGLNPLEVQLPLARARPGL